MKKYIWQLFHSDCFSFYCTCTYLTVVVIHELLDARIFFVGSSTPWTYIKSDINDPNEEKIEVVELQKMQLDITLNIIMDKILKNLGVSKILEFYKLFIWDKDFDFLG